MNELQQYVKDTINKYPSLSDEINDLYQLYLDEVEAGESRDNEEYLLRMDIDVLINNLKGIL